MSLKEAETIINYRDRFQLLEGEEGAKVDLADLWETLDQPYGEYKHWLSEVVRPLADRLSSEISDYIQKARGRGRPRIKHIIDIETAKHLALSVNNEIGDQIRSYFITVEKLFKSMVKHNALRVDIHDYDKSFYRESLLSSGYDKKEASKKLITLNSISKAVDGGRNELGTKLNPYEANHIVIGNLLLKDKDPKLIKMLFS
ncbi:TPA: hypothetical protein SCS57_002050 [Enterobacter cloacae]|nr:hypothetical protein [Enterobacter cloacae]